MPANPLDWREDSGARQRVAGIQRARILSALVEVSAERGAAKLTVGEIVARAGMSRRTFYELFEDCEECLLAAFDDATAAVSARVLEGYRAHTRWRERIRAGLSALLSFLDERPELARLLIVESLGAGPRVLERRARVLAAIVAAVDAGRAEAKADTVLAPLTAEGVVGGALAVIHRCLLDGGDGRLFASPAPSRGAPRMGELLNPLMSMIVLPYLGAAAARKEAERPLSPTTSAPRSTVKPLANLPMRVTYRTMRVLAAIEALGGRGSYPSNRQVGRAAGIEDQGQMSKLLARLKRVGLIETADPGKGAPNAWRLTRAGSELQAAIAQPVTSASSAAPSRSPTPSSGAGARLSSR